MYADRLNPLEHMRSLRIDNTADLSAPALFLLLQRATNLEEVIGTETWQDLDLRTCADLTDLFDRHHLPHRSLPDFSLFFQTDDFSSQAYSLPIRIPCWLMISRPSQDRHVQ